MFIDGEDEITSKLEDIDAQNLTSECSGDDEPKRPRTENLHVNALKGKIALDEQALSEYQHSEKLFSGDELVALLTRKAEAQTRLALTREELEKAEQVPRTKKGKNTGKNTGDASEGEILRLSTQPLHEYSFWFA